ncbi:hypothetical protein [Sphingomonas ginsenosidivorax]|uniref:hypothetical protein n=1 Tax=Sphingomonas ginsenosidivorax TaxID=862135 RepID=UPI0018F46459|nr:hypothetical protein [Sphingomonas ginsenosidivorax]
MAWATLAIIFMALALLRPVDHDESQYVAATVLTTHGLLPYRDFAYLQTPLQPFLFAPIAGPWTWPALRIANALLGGRGGRLHARGDARGGSRAETGAARRSRCSRDATSCCSGSGPRATMRCRSRCWRPAARAVARPGGLRAGNGDPDGWGVRGDRGGPGARCGDGPGAPDRRRGPVQPVRDARFAATSPA